MTKVSELEGALLDYWVLKALGEPAGISRRDGYSFAETRQRWSPFSEWKRISFVSNWANAGPIIERQSISFYKTAGQTAGMEWCASADRHVLTSWYGPTPLIAAMRAYVARKFGEEVPDAPTP